MDENITSNRTTSNSSIFYNLDDVNSQTAINKEFEVRNLIVGSLGIFMNSLAFLVVLKTEKVLQGRRLLLLSLIASDITLMISLTVYGLDKSARLSEGEGCVPVVILICLSVMVTDVITVQLSALNVLAIYQPFHFRRFVTLKNSGIAVALAWIVNFLLCVWLIGFEFSPGKTCAPVVTITPTRLVGIALVSISSGIGVMILNLVVIIKVKKRHQPYHRHQQQMQRRGNDTNETHQSRSKNIRFLEYFRKNRVQPFPVSLPSERAHEIVCISQITPIGNNALQCELVPRANPPVPCPQHRGETSTSAKRGTSGEANPVALSSTLIPNDKIRITLLVLTTYSALISLPLSIYLWCIATRLIEDLENVVGTPLGIFLSSLPMVRACINPVFYVLRFVNWTRLINKIKRRQ